MIVIDIDNTSRDFSNRLIESLSRVLESLEPSGCGADCLEFESQFVQSLVMVSFWRICLKGNHQRDWKI